MSNSIDSNLADFLISTPSSDLIENLKSLAEAYGVKDKKGVDEFVGLRIQLLFSFLTQKKNFNYDETNKKCFKNILEIIEKLSENDNELRITHLFTLYGILPENSQFKHDSLQIILNFLLSLNKETSTGLVKNHNDKINEVISDYFSANFAKDYEFKTIELIAEIPQKISDYQIIQTTKLNTKTISYYAYNPVSSQAAYRLLFFCSYSSFSIENFKGYNENLTNSKYKGEDEDMFIKIVKERNLSGLNSMNLSYFEETYGKSDSDKIFKNAKLWIIYSSLQTLENNSTVSFDSLESEFKVNIEDLEDVLFDGLSAELFKLTIDYENNLVKVSYVKKSSYDKEYVAHLKKRVTGLREKFAGFTKKIDSLIISN